MFLLQILGATAHFHNDHHITLDLDVNPLSYDPETYTLALFNERCAPVAFCDNLLVERDDKHLRLELKSLVPLQEGQCAFVVMDERRDIISAWRCRYREGCDRVRLRHINETFTYRRNWMVYLQEHPDMLKKVNHDFDAQFRVLFNRFNHVDYADDSSATVSMGNMRRDLGRLMKQLDHLAGLDGLKDTLRDIFKSVCLNKARRTVGLQPTQHPPYHFVFTGNPGTGKTTVARLMGKIFHEMGLLTEGDVICHDRRSLMGQFIGETENKFTEILEKAEGNVLFIDEAYALLDGNRDSNDFGKRIIEALLTITTDPNANLIVILAGYKDQMQRLIDSNPGLRSRFSQQLHFEDFSDKELFEIGKQIIKQNGLKLDKEAKEALSDVMKQTLEGRDAHFGNGRWVTEFVENGIVQAMASRLMEYNRDLTQTDLLTVTADDIRTAADGNAELQAMKKRAQTAAPKRQIGFQ